MTSRYRQTGWLATLTAALLFVALFMILPSPVHAVTFTVDNAGDAGDALAGDGVCDTGGAACTLRAAIEEANALAGPDVIEFNIGGGGAQTITLGSTLDITEQVTIDGLTQDAGASCGPPATLFITVDADSNTAFTIADGVNNVVLQGLAIQNADVGINVGTTTAGLTTGASIRCNEITLSNDGVQVYGTGNTIGGASTADRNLINQNATTGISVIGDNNTIQNNDITENGTGVRLTGDQNTVQTNVIGPSNGDGVLVDTGTGNVISQNQIFENTSNITLQNGGNNSQAAPGTMYYAIETEVKFQFTGTIGTTYRFEVFSSGAENDANTYLGYRDVTLAATTEDITINNGNLDGGSIAFNTGGPPEYAIVTATNLTTGDTSALSASVQAEPPPTLLLDPGTLPAGTINQAYSQELTPTDGTGPYTFAVTAGSLPPGFTISPEAPATGNSTTLSGTGPATPGSYNFTITVTDSNTFTADNAYTLEFFDALVLTPPTLPEALVGAAYGSFDWTTSGGVSPIVFSITPADPLPSGITFVDNNDGTATLSGTPDGGTAGSYPFTVTATDDNGFGTSVNSNHTLIVNDAIAWDVIPAPPDGVENAAYTATTWSVTGGLPPVTFSISAGSLPPGLSLTDNGDRTATVDGTPTTAGPYNFTVTATDDLGNSVDDATSIEIIPELVWNTLPTLPDGVENFAYGSFVWDSDGGATPVTLSATGVPSGMTFTDNGDGTATLSGTPDGGTAGPVTIDVTATDNDGTIITDSQTITIHPALTWNTTPTLADGVINTAIPNYTWDSDGGAAPITVTATGAMNGLSFADNADGTGTLSGTPTAGGTQTIIVTATDNLGNSISDTKNIFIYGELVWNTTPTLPNGVENFAYGNVTWDSDNGLPPVTLSATGVPAGMTFTDNADGTGTLSGTPNVGTAGPVTIDVTATDDAGNTVTDSQSFTISPELLWNTTPTLADVVVNTAIPNYTWDSDGGSGTVTLSSSGEPAGVTFTDNGDGTGTLSGTPTATGAFPITITATDSLGNSIQDIETLLVQPDLVWNTVPTLNDGAVGAAYGPFTWDSDGGKSPVVLTEMNVPAGVTFTDNGDGTGTLSGTPTASGTFNIMVTATDDDGNFINDTQLITINDGLTLSEPLPIPDGVINTAYPTKTWTASGGVAPVTISVTVNGGNLPNGTLDFTGGTTGTLSGTPTVAETLDITVTAQDSLGNTDSASYTITINDALLLPPGSPSPEPLDAGAVGSTYLDDTGVKATGGSGVYTYSLESGSLPFGTSGDPFVLDPNTGDISGTPSVIDEGTFQFRVRVEDSLGAFDLQEFTITIYGPLDISIAGGGNLETAQINQAYNETDLEASGGLAPYTFTLVTPGPGENFPVGLTLQPNGDITGTPTDIADIGTNTFTVQVEDAAGSTYTEQFSLEVIAPPLNLPSATLAAGQVNLPYSSTAIQATGGTGNYSYAFIGSPFNGLTIDPATGEISGTPTAADSGSNLFNVQVTDTVTTNTATQTFSLFVFDELRLSDVTLAEATISIAYSSSSIGALGGQSPYTFSSPNLPTWLTLNPTNADLSGTPPGGTPTGPTTFTVEVVDNLGATASRDYSITVNAEVDLDPTAPPTGNVGIPYSHTLTTTGGEGNYTYTLASGSLPTNFTLDSATGEIRGTTTVSSSSNFSVTVTDSGGGFDTESYTLTIISDSVTLTVNPTPMQDGVVGDAYPTYTLSALGGTSPYTFTVTGLPPGIACTGCGTPTTGTNTIGGTPTTGGDYTVTITVTDSTTPTPTTDTLVFNVSILAAANIQITTPTLPNGVQDAPYSETLTATGGTAPYSNFVVTNGTTLPAGLTLNPTTGELSGTPTATGTFTFDVEVTDDNSNTGVTTLTLTVGEANIQLPDVDTTFIVGQDYTGGNAVIIQATGGVPAYSYTSNYAGDQITIAGITIDLSGDPVTISGTPTQAVTFPITITATDSGTPPNSISREYSIDIIDQPAPGIEPPSMPDGVVGSTYPTQTVQPTGSNETYTLTLESGTIPPGLTFNPGSGVISGTPTTQGTYTFQIKATYQTAGEVTGNYTIRIRQDNNVRFGSTPPPGSTINFGEAQAGQVLEQTITVREDGTNALLISAPPGGVLTGDHASDFTISAGLPPITIPDGGQPVTITIQCTPSEQGIRTAALQLATNDPTKSLVTYNLTCGGGEGVESGVSVVEPQEDSVPGEGDDGQIGGIVGTAEVTFVRGLALRTGPYLGATMIGVIRPDREYPILAYNDSEGDEPLLEPEQQFAWYLIIDTYNDNRIGWASGRYLEIEAITIPYRETIFDTMNEIDHRGVTVLVQGNSNVRLHPSLRSPEVTPPTAYGVELNVYARTMQAGEIQWLLVEHQGVRGWIKYLPETMSPGGPIRFDALPIW